MSEATNTRAGNHEPERHMTIGDCRISLLPRCAYEVSYRPTTDVIGFAFETQSGFHAFASDVIRPFHTRPNSLSWVPAGCEVWSSSNEGGEYLTISQDIASPGRTQKQGRFNDYLDTDALTAAHTIRRLLLVDHDDAYSVERNVQALIISVMRILGLDAAESSASGWMTRARLRQLDEYIDAHMSERMSVAELAASCGLSAGFLNRAMQAAIGRSLHEHVLDKRIGRARHLLCSSHLSIMQIALDCGFSSHSHLTATMRRRLGITPSLLRCSS